MMNKIFACVIVFVCIGCNEPANSNLGMPDGDIPDGMVIETDAGMIDSGMMGNMDANVDSGNPPINVNQCLTNNGGCFPGVVCTDHNDPLNVTCGSCPVGYVGNGVTCTALKHWVCSANPVNNVPGYVLASCPVGNAYVGGVTDAKNALNAVVGDFYVITGSNDQLSSNNVQTLYRVCSFDSVNEPVTGNGVTIVDCAEVP